MGVHDCGRGLHFCAMLHNSLAFVAIALGFLAPPRPALAEAPGPVAVEIETRDGVLLQGSYFRSSRPGKNAPVVVMLADADESPAMFDKLATRLQGTGQSDGPAFSTIAIALRGQGDSTRVRVRGEVKDLRGAKLTPADAAGMVKHDLEAVRRFLVDKNDKGELNLNRLGYLGVGLGAIVATNAAAVDWAVPLLSRGKQGRDVKAVVLVSPPWKQLGLDMLKPLRQPGLRSEVAVLITYGGEDKSVASNVGRIVKQLEAGRPKTPPSVDGKPTPEPSVVDAPGASQLQGSAWLKQAGEDGEKAIERFFQRTLAAPELPWTKRRLD